MTTLQQNRVDVLSGQAAFPSVVSEYTSQESTITAFAEHFAEEFGHKHCLEFLLELICKHASIDCCGVYLLDCQKQSRYRLFMQQHSNATSFSGPELLLVSNNELNQLLQNDPLCGMCLADQIMCNKLSKLPIIRQQEMIGFIGIPSDQYYTPADLSFIQTVANTFGKQLILASAPATIGRFALSNIDMTARQQRAINAQAIRENERAALARELHDEFAQTLTALKLDLSWLQRRLVGLDSSIRKRAEDMAKLIEQSMTHVWRIANNLRPKLLEELGLRNAIQWQLDRFVERTDILCHSDLRGLENLNLPQDFQVAIYRIFQEALSNVARHSLADKVFIQASTANKTLSFTISDNGIGIKIELVDNINSIGLSGMQERAEILNGKITFENLSSGGTRISLTAPLIN